jgi:hypothetical protein
MSPEYMEGCRSDRLPNVTGVWLEGRLPLPSMNLIAALESSFDVVFALFGIGRNATPAGSIINKLGTDRFQSMNKSLNNHVTVQERPFNGGDNQRWQLIN